MKIPRSLHTHILELCQYFPIISLTGPRQAGKTTLLKSMFPDYRYVSLEDPDQKLAATDDPRSFLKQYDDKVIFDEAQRVPTLFSYLQTTVDEDRTAGRYILSGSQNFLLRKNITQSLAGRVGITRLFPLDIQELMRAKIKPESYETSIFKGFYPTQFDTGVPARLFYPSYVSSYIERDVSGLISASNLNTFQRFLQICATYAAQLLNYAQIANAVGVSVPTIQNWFSVLEQSYLVFRLPPYFRNFGKRIVKSPKLYFYDTGLLCYLLNMKSPQDIINYYQFGALFENLVVAEHIKMNHHSGESPRFYFYRDSNQLEVDLLREQAGKIQLTEIKANRTFSSKMLVTLNRVEKLIDQPVTKELIYGGDEIFEHQGTRVRAWFSVKDSNAS
ncbi:MAG: ATP-binding protein [Bacteroidota bacterium]